MTLLIRLSMAPAMLAVLCGTALAADVKPDVKAAAKPVASAKKPASASRAQLKSEAKGLALATETVEAITQTQLDIAARVLTGSAQCEFNQRVEIDPVEGKPGLFKVGFNGRRYTMSPQETSTGAVRLEDKAGGAVWLQIPAKSMLLDTKIGQRLVDACTQAEQRAAVNAVQAASASVEASNATVK